MRQGNWAFCHPTFLFCIIFSFLWGNCLPERKLRWTIWNLKYFCEDWTLLNLNPVHVDFLIFASQQRNSVTFWTKCYAKPGYIFDFLVNFVSVSISFTLPLDLKYHDLTYLFLPLRGSHVSFWSYVHLSFGSWAIVLF